MTHQQIADDLSHRTGRKIARSTVSVALARAGEANKRPRYRETVPWHVPSRFAPEYPLRMLRLLGKARQGAPLDQVELDRLENWLLDIEGYVVAFCPTIPEGKPGFYYIPDEARDHEDETLPIRKQPVAPNEIGF